jgi:hypothetical protein
MEFLDIGDVKAGDEVLAVEFRCRCGHLIDTIPIDENGGIDRMRTAAICEKRCGRCAEYSDFNYLLVDKDQSTEKSGDRAERQDAQRNLCTVLARNLKQPTEETRSMIQALLKGRNLKLRFAVERLQWSHFRQ